jgi:DNA (cytosine-5)-methyltransferase 3A
MIFWREIELSEFVKKKYKEFGSKPVLFNPYNKTEVKDKHPTLTAQGNRQTVSSSVILHKDNKYYLATAALWEELQTVPRGYTNCVPENKAKDLLGNGWTVDVIAHILTNMEK